MAKDKKQQKTAENWQEKKMGMLQIVKCRKTGGKENGGMLQGENFGKTGRKRK